MALLTLYRAPFGISSCLLCYLHLPGGERDLFHNALLSSPKPCSQQLLCEVQEGNYLTESLINIPAIAYKVSNLFLNFLKVEYVFNQLFAIHMLFLSQGPAWVLLHPHSSLPQSNRHPPFTFLPASLFASVVPLVS